MAGGAGGAGAIVSGATGGGTGLAALSNPIGWALIGVSALSSIFGGRSEKRAARKAARARMAMGRYNANVARENANAESKAIGHAAETLTLTQREKKAQQRMNVAGRGGTEFGTDLSSLMQQQTLMQLDSLEMQRRSQLAIISGEKEAEQILMEARTGAQVARAQGRAAEIKGYTQAASTLASGYLTYG